MFQTSLTAKDLLFMLQGAGVTLELTAGAMLLGTLGGIPAGLLRALAPRASLPLAWLLDVFRSVPLLIQFVLFNAFNNIAEVGASPFGVACIVLGFYTAAYCSEIVNSGVQSVPQSLYRAGRSLGLSAPQCLFYVVAPMAIRVSFPGWVSLTLGVMKDTALVLWIGVIELLRASQTIVVRIQEPLLVLCIAGAIYYLMSLAFARAGAWVEHKWKDHD